MRELSIYIHIPFCVRKCLYCDFLSAPAGGKEMESYVNLLLREIEKQSIFYGDHTVISIFLGGGTPSLLSGGEVERILARIRKNFIMAPDVEITMECNPGTVTPEKMESYIASGINRLSIGLQSTEDEELARIGRIHSYGDFLEIYELARGAGFGNINIDLMSGLPGQSSVSWKKTLERVTALLPEHISAYSLILEEGTPLYVNQSGYTFPTEEEDREMYALTGEYLAEAGYCRYEISNYGREGFACRHNKVYWKRGDYAGFGLGHPPWLTTCAGKIRRTMRPMRFVWRAGNGGKCRYLRWKSRWRNLCFSACGLCGVWIRKNLSVFSESPWRKSTGSSLRPLLRRACFFGTRAGLR